jgi:hypothetical protein
LSQLYLNAFIADVTALKAGSRFYSPSINIDDKYGWRTSVKGLIVITCVGILLVQRRCRYSTPYNTAGTLATSG